MDDDLLRCLNFRTPLGELSGSLFWREVRFLCDTVRIPRLAAEGALIITTRNEQLQFYRRSCKISRMSELDAKALFVHRSLRKSEDEKTGKLITELIEVCIYLLPIFATQSGHV